MRDAATLLRLLVDETEQALGRPRIGSADGLGTLHAEIVAASPMLPDPDGGLLIDVEATLLAQVLHFAARENALGDKHRLALMQQLAGVLLPAVRAAVWRAIEVRRAERPTV
jgi:hypothetical protein